MEPFIDLDNFGSDLQCTMCIDINKQYEELATIFEVSVYRVFPDTRAFSINSVIQVLQENSKLPLPDKLIS